jgi:hypothetical protein
MLKNNLQFRIKNGFHRLFIDDDSNHTSFETNRFLIRSNITLLKASVSSPDISPIELIWNEMNHFHIYIFI